MVLFEAKTRDVSAAPVPGCDTSQAALVFLGFERRQTFNCAREVGHCHSWGELLVVAEEDEIGMDITNRRQIVLRRTKDGMRLRIRVMNRLETFSLHLDWTFPLDAFDGFIARDDDPGLPPFHGSFNDGPVTGVQTIECSKDEHSHAAILQPVTCNL